MTQISTSGHLFVIDGDLTKVDCDAVLVPVDAEMSVTETWWPMLGIESSPLVHEKFAPGVRSMRYQCVGPEYDGPTIWLGDIGHDRPDNRWYARGLIDFVSRAARDTTPREIGRPPRLAVNVAGSGQGGSRENKGQLFKTIVPALQKAAAAHRVDVVLVCWGTKPYAAAQRARYPTALPSPLLDSALSSTASSLAEYATRRELVLFMGAGVSVGAGLQSWPGLLNELLAAAPRRLPSDSGLASLDVRDQAEIIRAMYRGPKPFRAELERLLTSRTRYSLTHGLLASLQTHENVTTNYDRLFEEAASTADRHIAQLPHQPAPAGDRWILKLHGSVGAGDELVLTRTDYLGLPNRAGALFGVLQAMLMTKHMLFIGYSLTDDSFHRVMHEVRAAMGSADRKTLGTALVLFRDPLLERLWGDVLDIVPMMDRPGTEPTAAQRVAAAHRIDLLLDRVCLEAADVSSFLLDPSYRRLLTRSEQALARHLGRTPGLDGSDSSPIADRVRETLLGMGMEMEPGTDVTPA